MMARGPYVDLCLAVQALRRDAERVRTPLVPATGVAAFIYTHQLANTLRILTDLRVRHLLADEVGLGKTVQALMVLNALRSERLGLRVLVIVPDRLAQQWRDEILTRAHTAPIGSDQEAEGSQYIRLAWEALLRTTNVDGAARWSLSDIDAANYDVLVVDELHRLRADVQDRIVRAASSFEHVLILSATPAFQRPDRHAQIFAVVEPERTAIARWEQAQSDLGTRDGLSVDDSLSRWPEWATRAVVDALLERDRVAAEGCLDDSEDNTTTALAHCAYRRIIRTRRVDYSGILPQRRHIPMMVEPLAAEEERQTLLWRYFSYLDEFSTRFDAILLAKRVILSPPSLEKRLDYLRRTGHERDGLLERAKPLVHRSRGDSRLDALIDLLVNIWSADPTERVLVAAQDNPTIDYLFEMIQARLPVIGPLFQRVPLVIAAIRQGQAEEMLEDLGGFGNKTTLNLDLFQRGEAQLLLAPEKAQVGLNLQRARVLVLYSVPWRPEEVEQWIGRLDRIGNAAAFTDDEEARSVDVYTITQRGLVDDKVVAVLRRFNVFEKSVNLDGEHLEEVARAIEAAVLRPETASWRDLENATETMAAEDEVQELKSALRPWLPWTMAAARSLRQQVDGMKPAAPTLTPPEERVSGGPRSWDRAMEGMVKLLKRSGEYHIRSNVDSEGGRFSTLWYQFGEKGLYNRRDVLSRVILSFGADPSQERSPRYAHAFITRRGEIGSAPRRSVTMRFEGGEFERPLHFLSFGDPLHDELVKGWMPPANLTPSLEVSLFEDHAFFSRGVPGLYVLRMSVLDAANVVRQGHREELALERMALAASTNQPDRLLDLLEPYRRQVRCALEADARWLRSQLPTEFLLDGMRHVNGQWNAVDGVELGALLNPLAHKKKGLPSSSVWQPLTTEISAMMAALERLRATDRLAAKRSWSHHFPAFDRSLAARCQLAHEEQADASSLAGHRLRDAEQRLQQARERGNRPQAGRAEKVWIASRDAAAVTQAFWDARAEWLEESSAAVRELTPNERMTAFIRVRRVRGNGSL